MKNLTVKKIGKASVIVDIVEKGNIEIRPGTPMNPSEIAVHNTGNAGRGADAESHNKYIHNQAGKPASQTGYASWHFSVDENYIYQHIPLDESAWHTGDGSGISSGNRNAIGIEICEHVDQKNYHQAEENAIALIIHLINTLNINVQKVKPHQAYSGKYCPRVILKRDGGFVKFHNRVKKALVGVPVAKPVTQVKPQVAGVSTVTVRKGKVISNVWTQKQASFSESGRVKIVEAGAIYKIYNEENGYYNLGGNEWINKKYMEVIPEVKQVKITVDVWSQRNAFYINTGRVKILKKGSVFKVYSEKDGFYYLGGSEWVNKKYAELI